MKQTGLIDCVIETIGLDSCMSTPKWTPAEGTILVCDKEGVPPYGNFNYSSVVEILLYVSGNTWPDIAYALNCCVGYMFNSHCSHEIVLI